MNTEIRVSFVVVGRNDGYGGDFVGRLKRCVETLAASCRSCRFAAELGVVDWNPPADRPPLAEVLAGFALDGLRRVTVTQVPASIHARLPNSQKTPLHEFVAKNVGVRRSVGEYVCATNADVLLSPRLVRNFSTSRLSARAYYRADRHDLDGEIPPALPPAQMWAFCRRHTYRIAAEAGFRECRGPVRDALGGLQRFFSKARIVLGGVRRLGLGDRHALRSALGAAFPVHVCAAGDFFLAHRDVWMSISGYPELCQRGGIDEYPCYLSAQRGCRQVVFGAPIYHQWHTSPEAQSDLWVDKESLRRSCRAVLAGDLSVANGSGWGLAGVELPQVRVLPRH